MNSADRGRLRTSREGSELDWLTLVVLTLQKDFSEMVLTVPTPRGFEEEQGALITPLP